MILSDIDFEAITQGRHSAPHQVLGMHQLADGGVVVRALLPLAKGVVVVPQLYHGGMTDLILLLLRVPFLLHHRLLPYSRMASWSI